MLRQCQWVISTTTVGESFDAMWPAWHQLVSGLTAGRAPESALRDGLE